MKLKKMQLFLCYNFVDDSFIRLVSYYLGKQETLKPYIWTVDGSADGDYPPQIKKALKKSDVFLLFLGKKLGKTQKKEVDEVISGSTIEKKILIKLGKVKVPKSIEKVEKWYSVPLDKYGDEKSALACAKTIVTGGLHKPWIGEDGVPEGYLFDYEKDIIKEYIKGISGTLIEKGCPSQWPMVKRNRGNLKNRVNEKKVGLYRDWDYVTEKIKNEDPQVIPAALSDYHVCCLKKLKITFPEAGPRRQLYYPTDSNRNLRVGILVSGGIAPGINSVIAGIVERQSLYAKQGRYLQTLRILGFLNGFSAIPFQRRINTTDLNEEKVANIKNDGGSFIGSSRVEVLADYSEPILRANALEDLARRISEQVDILYVIGGHGSMRAAHAIWKIARDELNRKLSVVAIPKTMDNDILWVWQSFGFMSAVERAKELIDYMSTEVKSYPGLCVIQLFGSDSGFVASHAVQASGLCDVCLIPEVPFTIEALSEYVKQILIDKYKAKENPYSIIVMAETAVPTDIGTYMDDEIIALTEEEKKELRSYQKTRRLTGHTPDPLRRGTLKVVSRVLEKKIREIKGEPWNIFRVITNEPKHLIRAIPPSCSDMIFGQRLGSLAVDCAMAGYTDFMISQWLTEYVMVPLPLVILGRKRIPKEGIFWNSVRATTGQPDLV